ncbi:MAG: amidohydrolase [Candidatus Cloacimonetes bacterium]|nr:amidohydrolase [Candidatus Cloacimonadota bacterium]
MTYSQTDLIAIRHFLHRNPELSSKEQKTAEYIISHLKKLSVQQLLTGLGGHGVAAVFDSGRSGMTLCFRAELDALPIQETSALAHVSSVPGVAHLCGHDGHATTLLGLADWLNDNPEFWTGKVIILFQPAEETAQGAKAVIREHRFLELKPDYIFALHNLPGFEQGTVIIKAGTFTSSTCGIKIKLRGRTSHAAHPKEALNPKQALFELSNRLEALASTLFEDKVGALVTIIHLRLGEIAFGTTPGEAELMATFRAYAAKDLELLKTEATKLICQIASSHGLVHECTWVDEFAAVTNELTATQMLTTAAKAQGLKVIEPAHPFLWSEDFSSFGEISKIALLGLGAALDHPQLHHSDYDFPDELIQIGIKLFAELIRQASSETTSP